MIRIKSKKEENVTFDGICQIFIIILGPIAIFLLGRRNRWGAVVGFVTQPFWFYTTYHNKQWGVFALCFVYAWAWIDGIYVGFWKKNKEEKEEQK